MPKESVLQIRIDTSLKDAAESLYREMGTTFSEAVRIFARQSVLSRGMPFALRAAAPEGRRGPQPKSFDSPMGMSDRVDGPRSRMMSSTSSSIRKPSPWPRPSIQHRPSSDRLERIGAKAGKSLAV